MADPTVVVTEEAYVVVAVDDVDTNVIVTQSSDIIAVPDGSPVDVVVGSGAQGPPGPMNLFIQNAPPSVELPTTYLWVQTGLGVTGEDMTFWVEDGS